MRPTVIVSLVIAALAVIFALQNATTIDLHIGPYIVQGSLALVLIITLVLGALIGYLGTLPSHLALKKELRALQKHEPEPELLDAEADDFADDDQMADAPPH